MIRHEEVLFEIYSDSWERKMPVTLIHLPNNHYDLHLQTGEHFDRALKSAQEVLEERGLEIVDINEKDNIYPSGVYYKVRRK